MKRILFFVVIFISFIGISKGQLPNYVPSNGLVGWWPFNGNANDESGSGNNGIVNGASLTADRLGNPNSAYSFNGLTNYILVPDNTNLNNNYLSVSLWIKSSNTNFQQFIYKTNLSTAINEEYSLATNYNFLNNIDCSIKNGNNCNNPGSGWQHNNVAYTINNGVWLNLIFTYNGTISSIYINGLIVNNAIFAPGTIDNCPGGDLIFGRAWNATGFFSGEMDDIGIWNRALTQQEITTIYNSETINYVGINTTTPARNLHINNVLRLEPRSTAPLNPSKGDIYFDNVINKLCVYDGTIWQNCW